MCGIFCELYYGDAPLLGQRVINDEEIIQRLKNRGPNCVHQIDCIVGSIRAIFCGSVLWTQGPQLTPQPLEDDCGILLYNGDIFDSNWDKAKCDTQIIMEKLSFKGKLSLQLRQQHLLLVLKTFKGPFSLVYYDKITNKLFFTRDRLGRNSLLFHKNSYSIVISSVLGRKYKSFEVPATNVHELDLDTMNITLHPWAEQDDETISLDTWINNLEIQQGLSDQEFHFEFNPSQSSLTDEENVIKHVESASQEITCRQSLMKKLLENVTISNTVDRLTELLEKSIKVRLKTQPHRCKECLDLDIPYCKHCTVGVLFSGGLDCTLLAYLADKYLPKDQPIDLINVAFNKDGSNNFNVPDRITGELSYKELQRTCPNRKWVLRNVNITSKELEVIQDTTIADLIYPRQTILDESLGSALWFAARGQDGENASPCRVILLGSGADELFGGYTRHRNAFRRHSWLGLQKELMLDWRRISYRNLSRDNRVICDHGRQPRMPYLDEEFCDYVLTLKPWLRCFPSDILGPGLGDKLILRLVAFKLDLQEVSSFPKRALQFGSRVANKKDKGSDISKHFSEIKI